MNPTTPNLPPAQLTLGPTQLNVVRGDITEQRVDAVVTAANRYLQGGMGVDGAVHDAAGPRLLEACAEIGGCKTGDAVATPAFRLQANGVRVVIHAVGPVWHGGHHGEDARLQSAYYTSLQVAQDNDCRSVALPSISTGVYDFPKERAACLALDVIHAFCKSQPQDKALEEVRLVLFDAPTYECFVQAAAAFGDYLAGESAPTSSGQ